MNRLGVIGGIGPESTIVYYRSIMAVGSQRLDGVPPPVVINSIDVRRVLRLVGENARDTLVDYLSTEIERLARADASIALVAANTPHVVFDDLRSRSPIPLVSIVEATRDAAKARGLTRLGLFGTRFTMQGAFYPAVFAGSGIDLVRPRDDEQAFIHEKYVGELLNNVFAPETRARLVAIAEALRDRDAVDGIILAGTELPLLLTGDTAAGVPLLDTTQIHVMAAVRQAWGDERSEGMSSPRS